MIAYAMSHYPNQNVVSFASGDTNWTQVDYPDGIPANPAGCLVTMKSTDASGIADGSPFLYSAGQDGTLTAVDQGFLVSSSGQALTVPLPQQIWLKLTDANDRVQLLFMW